MLDLNQVRAFVAIVEHGGFARAAETIGTTQPVVSQQLKRLESVLATRLITRSKAKSTATKAGLQFLPHARALLRAEANARNAIEGNGLTIAASSNIGTYFLPAILARQNRRVLREINTLIGTNLEVADNVVSGAADVALMEWWDERSGFDAQVWHREPMVVIVGPNHKWARRRTIRREDLLSEHMIGGEPGTGTGRLLESLFGASHTSLSVGLTVGSTAAVKEAVKAGLGVSVVLERSIHEEVQLGSLTALRLTGRKLAKSFYAITMSDLPPTAIASVFTSQLD